MTEGSIRHLLPEHVRPSYDRLCRAVALLILDVAEQDAKQEETKQEKKSA